MRVYDGAARRDYEEVLRSIGARLDAVQLRDFVLVEFDDGFHVRGTAGPATWSGQSGPMTLHFPDAAIDDALQEAHGRRGTDHWGGRIETALRLVGRHVDSMQGSEILIVEQGEHLLLRVAAAAERPQFLELGHDNLSAWETEASGTRRR